ncbi:hypothetical protein RHGRI_019848 [Rhododendron griersonianum]|uniref:Fe2OG dioxygenase domain-containing protein n=1 Tax=Rhododendron griersonianum TaxID=479676 RepID=A0AAV6JE68_9ERIC|nr:hypothetical protein RHGRI_019848 [Rhododendron griersonianum]KAG5539446.1 hypothetical protein RHGRI_019848 [Rhododendron griersonianum]
MSKMNLLLTDLVSGVNHVPTNYIWPISDRPNLTEVEKSEGSNLIPVIDLQDLHGPDHLHVIAKIGLACQHHGFFRVKNHGVPETMIENVHRIAREFFRLPESERLKNYSDDPSKTTRLSTSFNVKTDKEVAEYCTSVRGLTLRLLGAISESLGLDRDYVSGQLGSHGQHMAMNYYPPCPEPELTYGLPGHTDPNLITILLQDDVPGLQVSHKGKWVAVNPIPNTFIINIGDQMQVISNDRYKSVLHRAVVNSDRERISIPTFYCPSPDAVIGSAPELVDDEDRRPAVYKKFTYQEYYDKFWNRGFATECCLDMFKV